MGRSRAAASGRPILQLSALARRSPSTSLVTAKRPHALEAPRIGSPTEQQSSGEPSRDRSEPVDVVAHSFGAAVALRFALEDHARVRTLTVVEPILFRLLRDLGPRAGDALRGIERIARGFTPSGPDQDRMFAIARFVDYWNGARTWAALPSQRQEMLALKSDQVRRDFEAIFSEPLCLPAFRKLNVPTLIVTGTVSPAAALLIAEGLARVAPRASSVAIAGAGHMLPVTHTPDLLRILQARLEVHASPTFKAA